MKKYFLFCLFASLIIFLAACSREEPQYVRNLRVLAMLPAHFKPEVKYGQKEVNFSSSTANYRFETDADGILTIPEIIPDIYTINTSWEISGKQYKEYIQENINLEDRVKVLVNATLSNVPVFSSKDIVMMLDRVFLKELLISKVYFSGTKDNANRNYVVDSFVEIFNNSDDVVYLDGKYLALAESRSPAAYLAADNPDFIYTRQICKFPGDGTDYPVWPGESIVIAARSARNHT